MFKSFSSQDNILTQHVFKQLRKNTFCFKCANCAALFQFVIIFTICGVICALFKESRTQLSDIQYCERQNCFYLSVHTSLQIQSGKNTHQILCLIYLHSPLLYVLVTFTLFMSISLWNMSRLACSSTKVYVGNTTWLLISR